MEQVTVSEVLRENNKLRSELRQKDYEIEQLFNMINGDYPDNVYWLMRKVDSQRRALDALQKKGKGHTREEREELALADAS